MMRRTPGFTLLEILVAIVILAIVAGALYGALYTGFRAQRSALQAVAPVRQGTLALELLRQDIEAAVPPTGILAGAFYATDLGSNDLLIFHSSANVPAPGEAGSDLRRVELTLTQDATDPAGTGQALVRRVTGNLLSTNSPVLREQVLCRNVQSFNLRYYDGTQWLESWDSTAQGDLLPLAVEIDLAYQREDGVARQGAAGSAVDQALHFRRVVAVPCGRTEASAAAEATP